MREYFAARYLYDTAPYSPAGDEKPGTLPERFDALASDLFWQNVTRFYAGCYSQGELPSLVTSLRTLSTKDGYRESCYPQSLAVTLLSDYTFAQYPLIVGDIVDFVLNSTDFRLFVASVQYRRRGDSLYLPKGSGNKELLDRCFEELRRWPQIDYANLLLRIIETNSTRDERYDRWWDVLDSICEGKIRTQWISYGLRIGVFQGADQSRLEALLSADEDEYQERVVIFGFGGMWEYVSQKEEHINTVVDKVLSRDSEHLLYRNRSIIESFDLALSSHRYAIVFRDRSPATLSRILDRYQPVFGTRQDYDAPRDGDYDIVAKCREYIRSSNQLSEKFATRTWATKIAPWKNLSSVDAGCSVNAGRFVNLRVWPQVSGPSKSSARKQESFSM